MHSASPRAPAFSIFSRSERSRFAKTRHSLPRIASRASSNGAPGRVRLAAISS